MLHGHRHRAAVTGTQLGYARVSTVHQSLDQQTDALIAAGIDVARVYTDKLSGTSTRQQRPGLAALLDYARQGDAIVVVGIDRLGRNAAEVMMTIRDLGERGIVLRPPSPELNWAMPASVRCISRSTSRPTR